MSNMPWVRFFPSDWLGGTRGMSAAEAGVYINLIAMMYDNGEPLTEDHPKLARLCGASNATFKRTLERLVNDGKIIRAEAGLWNDRVQKEQVYRSEKSAVGKQAADERWKKTKENQQAFNADAMRSQCDGNANQSPDIRIDGSSDSESVITVVPASAGPAPSDDRFAFKATTIKLSSRDLERWRKDFPHISLVAELWALDEWAGQQANWFIAVSGALAKKERAALERINLRKTELEAGPPKRHRDGRI